MSIITNAGRAAIAAAILAQPIHLALGDGAPGWADATPPLDYDTAKLTKEVGRKALHRGLYVYPDNNGEIILPDNKRYKATITPTRHLYLQFLFDYNEGASATIREVGILIGTKAKSGVPPTQTFLLPTDIDSPGTLLLLNYPTDPEKYNPQKKGSYEIVLSF